MTNIQGHTANYDQLSQTIQQFKPVAVVVTETHITEDILSSEIDIEGYNYFLVLSDSRHTGGVTIYVKKSVQSYAIETFQVNKQFWAVFVKIKAQKESIVLGGVYRSPNGQPVEFIEFMDKLFDTDYIMSANTILAGDFNINLLENSTYAKSIIKSAQSAGFKQIITSPTRITMTSSTLVDHVYSNMKYIQETNRVYPAITDHEILGINLNCATASKEKEFVRNLSEERINQINSDLFLQEWNYNAVDVNTLYKDFVTNITAVVEKIAPLQVKIRKSDNSWIDAEVIGAQKERDRLYNIFKYTNNVQDHDNYKKCRNEVVALIRKKEKQYYERKINENRHDSKRVWQILKKIVNKRAKKVELSFIESIPHNNLPDFLNRYFVDSIHEIASSIPNPDNDFIEATFEIHSSFNRFEKITLNKLRTTIEKLKKNKASGDEIICAKLIKKLYNVIGYPLLHIVNSSLESGILPKDLKCSVVVPVPKVDNPKKLEELRPVNLIPIIDKVLELLVHEQLTEYFEKNNIFCQGQFGFRNKHSCESACQFVFSKWKKDIDEGNIVLGVFVDLKRAFETIDRKKLIEMCGVYGVGGVALGWLGSYLDKRYQITKIDDRVSQQMEICYGVPQGSVLGPLLFILYINDITKYVRNSFVNLYADDTVLSVSGTNYLEVVNIMNSELKKLDNWLKFKKLKLNADKTKFMVFGSQHNCKLFKELNFNITIESVNIEQVDIFKYLGIQLDPQLKLSHHVDYMCRKLGKKIGYFNRISSRLFGWCTTQ